MEELHRLFGRSQKAATPGADFVTILADASAKLIENPELTICVVLVDGLGVSNLQRARREAPFLLEVFASDESDNSVETTFPSTTATAISSFTSGKPAAETGVVGYSTRHPKNELKTVAINWRNIEPFLPPKDSYFSQLTDAGVENTMVAIDKFQGSGFSNAFIRPNFGFISDFVEDDPSQLVKLLKKPGLVFCYWDALDKVGHKEGADSPYWFDTLARLDSRLSFLRSRLKSNTEFILTADHGMITANFNNRTDLANYSQLHQEVSLLAGEARVSFLYLKDPKKTQWFKRQLSDLLLDKAAVLSKDDLLDSGLYLGKFSDYALAQLPEIFVISAADHSLVDSLTQPRHALAQRGLHGSLTSAELLVPKLAF